jgi:Aminoglycoside-2''-adenylyltransferase
VNDLALVMKVVDVLEAARLRVWLFGGWAEELRGLRAPCEHVDVDFLYPGRDFSRVDRFLGGTDDSRPHKRSFEVEGVPVELLLVQKDERGWFTELPAGRHPWPADVFANAGRLPVASVTALESYRHSRRADIRAA